MEKMMKVIAAAALALAMFAGTASADFLSEMEREPEWSFFARVSTQLKGMGVDCSVIDITDNGIHEQSGTRWLTVICEGDKSLLLEVSTLSVGVFSCFDPSVPSQCDVKLPPVRRYSI
jgi:hypothetical protein